MRWNEIGTEQYVMVEYNNKEIKLREQLKINIIKLNYQYTQFSIRDLINIHFLANDIATKYFSAIFARNFFAC